MDHLSTLIPECLDLIITHLLLNNRQADVATLLQVNKTLAATALRHLYANPFQHPFHAPNKDIYNADENRQGEEDRVKKGPLETIDALAGMLLSRCVLGSVPKVVTVAFPELASQDTSTLSTPSSSSLNYMTHIRHLNLCIPIAYTWQHEVLNTGSPTTTLAYLWQKEFWGTCGVADMLYSCRRRFNLEHVTVALYHQFFRVQLMREVNWMLVNSFCVVGRSGDEDDRDGVLLGQQLKSLVIPASDMARYLEAVCQFESLEHVQVCLDEVWVYPEEDVEAALEEDDDTPRLLKRNEDRKEQAMQDLLKFVQEHGRIFPGQLKTVTCPESNIWEPWWWASLPQNCPEEVQFRLSQSLPPLKSPSVLNKKNWMQFLAYPRETDLGAVWKIDMPLGWGRLEAYERVVENRGFLQRCRRLRTLMVGSLGKRAYKWAVEEKKAYLKNNSGGNNNYNDKRQESLLLQEDEIEDRHLYLRHGLVPLEKADIWGLEDLPLKDMDEIDDIAYAFSETLTTLSLNMPYTLNEDFLINGYEPTPMWTIRIGRGWIDLPNLRDLYIDARIARLFLDPELLVHCPNLVSLDLYDDVTFDYNPVEAIRDEYLPALLSKCESMTLLGWSALTFHPETLSSMRERLVELSMQTVCGRDDLCFILPSPLGAADEGLSAGVRGREPIDDDDELVDQLLEQEQEQEQEQEHERPGPGWYRWTWDWELPQLTKLKLNSKFAYEFQFRFLASCPLLESLYLNIHTNLEQTRDLDRSVLSIPGKNRMIVLQKLRKLEMLGGWTVVGGDAFLEELLSTLCPNLEHLVAKHWNGVTPSGFLSILRKKDPISQNESPSMKPLYDEQQDRKECNKVRKMELAGKQISDGDTSELMGNLGLGLIYMRGDVDEEEVLQDVEFKLECSQYYVLKSPQNLKSSL